MEPTLIEEIKACQCEDKLLKKKYEEQKAQEAADEAAGKKKADEKPHKPKIRPLTEARAIELGANFFSEAFIFGVAVGLLLFENWRSRSKASARRDEVSERLEQLEAEVESLRAKLDPDLETLHDLSERVKEAKKRRQSWSGWVASGFGLAGQCSGAILSYWGILRLHGAELTSYSIASPGTCRRSLLSF